MTAQSFAKAFIVAGVPHPTTCVRFSLICSNKEFDNGVGSLFATVAGL